MTIIDCQQLPYGSSNTATVFITFYAFPTLLLRFSAPSQTHLCHRLYGIQALHSPRLAIASTKLSNRYGWRYITMVGTVNSNDVWRHDAFLLQDIDVQIIWLHSSWYLD
ncbi:unnamed protein product [Fusarium fujikuroi]|nr:unnamed protein product [Fusarium fujikuroi]